MKHTLSELDAGQLDLMWQFLQLGKQRPCADDVRLMIDSTDKIRQLLIQKSGGQRKDDCAEYVNSRDAGTYINFIVVAALSLGTSGLLDRLLAMAEAEDDGSP